ncbi:hypothetical protein FLL45_00370 [Aliikangiella marina]|uniref:Uncharacterized protein n=1 Tax=Aliikangiella marina TaxID=1712262 RepID=A0A545TGW7_9GAMM|nr:hypothetical protein [Aliikangiella marina]TQV76455.1 hypothetical protein FLL45_00370 [Aliikangiella marina]
MKENIYSIWSPLDGVEGRVYVDHIIDDEEGLTIYLYLSSNGGEKKFKMTFDPYIAYRNMDESFRSKAFSEHGGFDNSLNIVSNSSWIRWLQSESQGYYQEAKIVHYCIITDADFIDVLAEFPPEVEWVYGS